MMTLVVLPLTAQTPAGAGLAGEVQKISQILNKPGVSGTERHDALVKLARLYRLLGNLENSAQAWLDAALAEQGKQDDHAFLEGSLVFIALGEYDKARANLNTVLAGGGSPEHFQRARYISAQLEAFNGDARLLYQLLGDANYQEYQSSILYTLWRVLGEDAYRTKLLADYPASPEGRIAAAGPALSAVPPAAQVGPVQSAMWLLFPGRDSITLAPPTQVAPAPPPASPPPATVVPAGPSLLPPVSTKLPDLGRDTPLQTGLYSREENARDMVRRLDNAGFTAAILSRTINGANYWAVTVPSGPDIQQTILRLKNAGFESFPLK